MQWLQILTTRDECVADSPNYSFSHTELTFLALSEVILSILIGSFKFSLPENKDEIVWNLAGVRYPTVGKDSDKPRFPMRVELLE